MNEDEMKLLIALKEGILLSLNQIKALAEIQNKHITLSNQRFEFLEAEILKILKKQLDEAEVAEPSQIQ